MENYEERRQARIERLENRAQKKRAEGEALLDSAHQRAEFIPMGQPILIGHYSEGRHRRDLERIHRKTEQGIKALEEAKRLERRAEAARLNNVISSDDDAAVDKLASKLKALEHKRDFIKSVNGAFRKGGWAAVAEIIGKDRAADLAHSAKDPLWKEPFPGYVLQNLGAQIRSVTKRIEHLQEAGKQVSEEDEINGVRIVTNAEDNRIQLFFDGKPTEEIRGELKAAGFRWSPRNGCWQRMISSNAKYQAEQIAEKL